MIVKVVLTATDEAGETRSWDTFVNDNDEWVTDRLTQAGGDRLTAAAICAVHTYDIFPTRGD